MNYLSVTGNTTEVKFSYSRGEVERLSAEIREINMDTEKTFLQMISLLRASEMHALGICGVNVRGSREPRSQDLMAIPVEMFSVID